MRETYSRTQTLRRPPRQNERRPLVTALIFIAITAVIVAGWHYWTVYAGITGARDGLLAAQERLSGVGFDIERGDLDAARGRVEDARGDLASARDHMRWDPLIHAARVLPGTGTQVHAADDLLEIADRLITVADDAITAAAKAVDLRDAPPTGQPLTRSLVSLLDDTGPEIDRIATELEEVVRLRFEIGDSSLLGPLGKARDELDKELPGLASMVTQLQNGREVMPALLGFEGDRRYLVLALNNGELLPGGGLVTASGILPVTMGVNGALDFTDSVGWKSQAEALGIPYIPPPGPLQRYLLRDFTWNLLVSNWDPHYPTWAQQALEFHELINGPQEVDGVIAVDLIVLERLLRVMGPKTLQVDGRGAVTFDTNNAVLLLESLTRHAFEESEDRKSVIGDLAQLLMADLLTLPSDLWGDVVEVVRDLGHERHIQILSFDAEEQTLLRNFGWDGSLAPTGNDYFQFNEASLLSTKLNLIVKPEGSYHASITELGDVEHELRLRYVNPLPEWADGKDPELVRQLMLGGLYGGYLRIMGPRGISGFDVEVDGVPASVEDFGSASTTDWFGTFMTLAPGQEREVVLRWRSTARSGVSTDGYRLDLLKQPGTEGVCLEITLDRLGEDPRALVIEGGREDDEGRVCLTSDVAIIARF